MKYYFNFVCQPEDGAIGRETVGTDYTFPTDPMYKQDGVYNQRCKYKITNIGISDLLPAEVELLKSRTLIVRFNSLTCMNSWTLTSYGGAGGYTQLGQNNIEFHIRLNEDMIQQTGGTEQVVQTIAGLDTQGTTNIVGTFNANYEPDYQTFPSSQSRRDQVGDATLTTLAVAGTTSVYNNSLINFNTFSEELIGMPCWGEQVDLSFLYYGSTDNPTNLKDAVNTRDVNISFTLEVEPIAIKL
tara:strand:- start:19 stop:744 length:726 start_codon:yes stop_codon:yes gene_type:complete